MKVISPKHIDLELYETTTWLNYRQWIFEEAIMDDIPMEEQDILEKEMNTIREKVEKLQGEVYGKEES